MIAWREKFAAFAIHFLLTSVLAAGAAALIFFVWYPAPFQDMVGGTKLFFLVVGCDLVLGPLMSLVIYNSKKSRKELVTDYLIVGVIQLAALTYGVAMVADTRPVYVVFAYDRLLVTAADDLAPEHLKAARAPYDSRPKWGPQLASIKSGATQDERVKLRAATIAAGKHPAALPFRYQPYDTARTDILQQAKPLAVLLTAHPEAQALIDQAHPANPATLRWLPVYSRRGIWTALIDPQTARPVAYLPQNPR